MRFKHTNQPGFLLFGPSVATYRFFDTLNKIERKLNEMDDYPAPYRGE